MEDQFDALVRGMASGKLSRRQALGRIGVGTAGALLALLTPWRAEAAKDKCKGTGRVGCTGSEFDCCPEGQCCCQGLPSKEKCKNKGDLEMRAPNVYICPNGRRARCPA
jgi:hypothetical protein